jgi:hypothetical protein
VLFFSTPLVLVVLLNLLLKDAPLEFFYCRFTHLGLGGECHRRRDGGEIDGRWDKELGWYRVLTVVSLVKLEVGVLGCRDVLRGRGGCVDALTEVDFDDKSRFACGRRGGAS